MSDWLHTGAIACLLVLAPLSHALDPAKTIPQYVHKHWNNLDGLPQNTITSIAQTADGYLWMGTLEGLVRFDGSRFTLFNTRNSADFIHNMVVSLLVDSQDRLWVATSGGGLLILKNGAISRLTTAQGLPSDQVSVIFEDTRGTIWVGTDGGGLAKIVDGEVQIAHSFAQLGTSIRAIEESKTGLWIGTENGLVLLRSNGTHTRFDTRDGLSHASIRALLSDHSGALWVSTDLGLDKLELGRFTTVKHLTSADHDIVLAMHQDRDNNLWIGTDGGGLKRLHNGQLSTFASHNGLSNDSVLALYESADGSLWIGTNLGGLNQLKDGRITTFTTAEGLSANFIRAVHEDAGGTLWIGTEGGGLMRYRQGQFDSFTTANGLPDNTVFSILEDSKGELWIGTDSGVAHQTAEGFEVFDEQSGLSDNTVLALLEDSAGTLWIGTYAGGLNQFKDGIFTTLTTADGLGNNTVNTLLEDRSGALWIGTRGGGLSRLVDGVLTTFTTADGLSDDLVFALHEDTEGALWIGTYGGGLNRYRNGQFSVVNESHGLFDDVIHHIIDDGQGNFWMSSNRGIFAVDQAGLNAVADGELDKVKSIVFGTSDGMRNVECNGGANAGTLGRDGTLWFPSVEGLVAVAPASAGKSGQAAQVLIEEILVDGQRLSREGNLELDAGVKNLELHYTATELFAPEKLRFRYRLQGYDEHWIDAGIRRTAYYSQLPAGKFEFQVVADYGNNSWNITGDGRLLKVAPHYYETLWFRSAALFGLSLLIYGIFRIRVSRLTRHNLRLEELVFERTAELEAVNTQLSQLASEDGLTGLLNRRAFDTTFHQEYRRAERAKAPLALLLLDIDYFKQFNDTYGHPAGDVCLQQVARALDKACNRAGESVARYGGDEIAIILPSTTLQGAMLHAETLRQHIQELAIAHSGSDLGGEITASIGVSSAIPNADLQAADILAAADKALYRAKENGRNCIAGEAHS